MLLNIMEFKYINFNFYIKYKYINYLYINRELSVSETVKSLVDLTVNFNTRLIFIIFFN